MIDSSASSVRLHVGKTGLVSFAGHEHEVVARSVEGEVDADFEDLSRSAVEVVVDASSLTVRAEGEPEGDPPQIEQAMKGRQVLDAKRFPDIRFRSQQVTAKGLSPGSYQLTVAGGTPPFTWSIASGSLPSGLNLNAQTALLSGTPTTAGSSTFTAQVTDAASRTAQKSLAITVAPSTMLPLKLNLAATIQAVKGEPFTYQPEATGGTPPYTWSITAGALPAELALNAGTGAVTGTPAVSGDFNVTLTVRDQRNQSANGSTQIKVTEPQPAPVISKVKYKTSKRKLTVTGERLDANAALFIDGAQVSARFDSGTLIAKPLALAPGTHEIRVVNPGGVSSQPYSLTIE